MMFLHIPSTRQVIFVSKLRRLVFFKGAAKATTTKKKARGHPGSNRGPLDLQSNALPLSYIPAYRNYYISRLYRLHAPSVMKLIVQYGNALHSLLEKR